MNLKRKVDSVSKRLKTKGVKPIILNYGDGNALDPVIMITEDIYIQVGSDYMAVVKSNSKTFVNLSCKNNITDIMKKLKQAVDG